jgi:hypothetical protein
MVLDTAGVHGKGRYRRKGIDTDQLSGAGAIKPNSFNTARKVEGAYTQAGTVLEQERVIKIHPSACRLGIQLHSPPKY